MPREPIPVGGYGKISYTALGKRKVRAYCRVRDLDGKLRPVTREGTSEDNARRNLLRAIDERPGFTGSDLTAESRVHEAVAAWLASIDRDVENHEMAPNSARIYHGSAARHIVPAIGSLRLREATTSRLNGFLVRLRSDHGKPTVKQARTILNGVFGHAVREGALTVNPMRDVAATRGSRTKTRARALTAAERDGWLAAMENDVVAARRDIPDLTRLMICTGCRIGEALALAFDDGVDVHNKTVSIDWNIVRIKGVGLVREPVKTAAGERTLKLPSWGVDMLVRRGDRFGWTGPVFPIPPRRRGVQRYPGIWRDPSNTSGDIRRARERAGYGWVTSHNFRKTVATIMDEAGMTAREIADQLGHAKISMTQDVYLGRRVASEGAAVALEDAFTAPGQSAE